MGILNLKKQYPEERIEKAAGRALHFGNLSCNGMKNILAKGLDQKPLQQKLQRNLVLHENIRGQLHYT